MFLVKEFLGKSRQKESWRMFSPIFCCNKDFIFTNIFAHPLEYKSRSMKMTQVSYILFLIPQEQNQLAFLIQKFLHWQKIANVNQKKTELALAIVWNTSVVKIANVNLGWVTSSCFDFKFTIRKRNLTIQLILKTGSMQLLPVFCLP